MLRLRVRIDAAARTKNGHPAPSATGVARTSWIQFESLRVQPFRPPKRWPPMSRTTSGIASASANQSRRFMSMSSAFGPVSADGVSVRAPCRRSGRRRARSAAPPGASGRCKIVPAGTGLRRSGRGPEIARRVGGEFRPAAGAAEKIGPSVMLEPMPACRIDRHPADGVLRRRAVGRSRGSRVMAMTGGRRRLGGKVAGRVGGELRSAAAAAEEIGLSAVLEPMLGGRAVDRHPANRVLRRRARRPEPRLPG